MKIRNGFVSNSSSSSFLVYGSECPRSVENDEKCAELIKELGIEYIYGYEDEGISDCIGLSWDEVKDDETGKQFKERVEEAVKKILGNNVKCWTLSAAWRDG